MASNKPRGKWWNKVSPGTIETIVRLLVVVATTLIHRHTQAL